jgi:steroid delta-isomerase-like uncharacterized protein
MSTEENKAVIQRFFKEFIEGVDLDVADEIIADDYVYHAPPSPDSVGREGIKEVMVEWSNAFTDIRFSIDDEIAAGDKVVIRWTFHAIHGGDFRGAPATGKGVTMEGVAIYRVVDGQIVHHWAYGDYVAFFQQLGYTLVPPGQ